MTAYTNLLLSKNYYKSNRNVIRLPESCYKLLVFYAQAIHKNIFYKTHNEISGKFQLHAQNICALVDKLKAVFIFTVLSYFSILNFLSLAFTTHTLLLFNS